MYAIKIRVRNFRHHELRYAAKDIFLTFFTDFPFFHHVDIYILYLSD